jgi:hypothetical protein
MTVFAWVLTAGALGGMYPWARLLLPREADRLLISITTLAFSFGALSLILSGLGMVGIRIDWRTGGLIYIILIVVGSATWWTTTKADQRAILPRARLLPDTWRLFAWIALITTGILAALMLFNALYWPIGVDDAMAIYGYHGKAIAWSGALSPLVHGSLYEAYPMAIPLWHAFVIQLTQQFGGWIDEHLMALTPALLSLGVIPVAYLIGRELYDRTTGIVAALLITLTPTIAYWSSASYADLPAGFFYGLTVYFAIRQFRTRRWQDALLTGIMAGLAAWTKNSALLLVGVLVLWVAYCVWQRRNALLRPLTGRDVTIMVIGFAAVCGPWYARNWLLAGVIVPATGWTFAAQRTTDNLLTYFVDLHYWPTGFLFTIGLGWIIWQAWRARGRELASAALLIGYLPFFAIWWALFSYEDRFLLVLTPLIAVMGARIVRDLSELALNEDRFLLTLRPLVPYMGLDTVRRWVNRYSLPRLKPSRRLTWRYVGLLAVFAILPASNAVLFKNDILRHPLMSDADKHHVRFGVRYDAALYMQSLPAGTRVLSDDTLLPYLVFPVLVTVGSAASMADLTHYEYWAFNAGDNLPTWFTNQQTGTALTPVFQSGDYRIYALNALQSTP